jgi:hypothetical protein
MIARATPQGFIDAGYIIALHRSDDENRDAALRWAAVVRLERWRLMTTTAVLAEIGNAFAKQWFRIRDYLQAALSDPTIEVVPVTADLVERAVALRNRRPDKEWGLTDCISFVVMQDRGVTEALAADRHFEQAGFRALLREDPRASNRR